MSPKSAFEIVRDSTVELADIALALLNIRGPEVMIAFMATADEYGLGPDDTLARFVAHLQNELDARGLDGSPAWELLAEAHAATVAIHN